MDEPGAILVDEWRGQFTKSSEHPNALDCHLLENAKPMSTSGWLVRRVEEEIEDA
jgi:hypothetical protein